MSFVERPPVDFGRSGPPADDVDGLLREFFRSQLPNTWPALKPPAEAVVRPLTPPISRWSGFRSRFALAASIGLLLVGQWFLAHRLPTATPLPPGATGGPEASKKGLDERLNDKDIKMREDLILRPDGAYRRIQLLPNEERTRE
jgi:hypothetical protein